MWNHRGEDETPLVETDGAACRTDYREKRYKTIWWCCFGVRDDEEGDECAGAGRSSVLGAPSTTFQRIRRCLTSSAGLNRLEGEGNNTHSWWPHKGWNESVRRAREWSESVIEDAVRSSRPKWKRLVGNFKREIDGFRGAFCHSEPVRFRYDPASYALNFDGELSRFELKHPSPEFSARLAAPHPNPSAKSGSLK